MILFVKRFLYSRKFAGITPNINTLLRPIKIKNKEINIEFPGWIKLESYLKSVWPASVHEELGSFGKKVTLGKLPIPILNPPYTALLLEPFNHKNMPFLSKIKLENSWIHNKNLSCFIRSKNKKHTLKIWNAPVYGQVLKKHLKICPLFGQDKKNHKKVIKIIVE